MKRLRGRALQAMRQAILAQEPLCRRCQTLGLITPADEIDHIVPVHAGGSNRRDNLQPLCHECHVAKTNADARGYDDAIGPDGWPIDPRHPANAPRGRARSPQGGEAKPEASETETGASTFFHR